MGFTTGERIGMIRIYKWKACEKLHLEAGNALIHFPSLQRLRQYLDYLETIDAPHYAGLNRRKGLSKDVFLPVEGSTVNIAFSFEEFETMKNVIRNYLSEDGKCPFRCGNLLDLQVIRWN
jgi:hypothetical protein